MSLASSLWWMGFVAMVLTGVLWLQANSTYVFEITSKELDFERRSWFSSRRRSFPQKSVRDIQMAKNRSGRSVALIIRSPDKKLAGRYFEYLDEQCIQQVAAALREGLALTAAEAK